MTPNGGYTPFLQPMGTAGQGAPNPYTARGA